ncbi:MAG TPA: winged helix-turn-helix domain-containing protein, partial [Methanomassiliicoccales archaeon]|nr:winged helix-turn-helix domain-containing protein [Methanomassiliicoccales archaeon]
LDELRGIVSKLPGEAGPDGSSAPLLAVLDRSRQQMALMETLRFHIGRPMLRRSCESAFGGMEPEDMEGRLAPLSNATRLRVMALLYTSSRSFTEMGRELGMQKGHLQFHLRKLVGAGYVLIDRRTHQYTISEKGALAVDGLCRLLPRL